MTLRKRDAALFVGASLLLACGAKTPLRIGEGGALDVAVDEPEDARPDAFDAADVVDVIDVVDVVDAADVVDVIDAVDVVDVVDVPDVPLGCVPVRDNCGAEEICGNGDDDDCNGPVDDGCTCTPGAVQSCFAGPPGRRNIGACRDGMQTCLMSGRWGACEGGITPREDVCNGLDNLCTGCSRQSECPIACPGPGDPRVRTGQPLQEYPLRGGFFYNGPVRAWAWSVVGGPCDSLGTAPPSFELRDPNSQNATLFPRLSGDYTVTLRIVTEGGRTLSCTWVVHIAGAGLRVEMCYPESTTEDVDLFISRPGSMTPWFRAGVRDTSMGVSRDSCGWHNCEAMVRGAVGRVDWGYANSALANCAQGPQGDQWRALGFCTNPRLDIDNNLVEGTGLPENINLDAPRGGETYRIMAHNFSGGATRPLVNVYCSGRRVATYGAAPDQLVGFTGINGNRGIGAMWRVADVTVQRNPDGSYACVSRQVPPFAGGRGYNVTFGDGRY